MSFSLRPHTADVAVEARGATLAAAFAAAGDGLAAAHCDDIPPIGERFPLTLEAEGIEALLFDFLDDLIVERDVRNVLPVDLEVTIEEAGEDWHLRGSARGVPIEAIEAREIKAVTYSEMRIEEVNDGWRLYVVLDV